jgi:drug/metabolite transporter (DMT)-like permease
MRQIRTCGIAAAFGGAPCVALAHGIGLGEVGFVTEIFVGLLVLGLLWLGEPVKRALLLDVAFLSSSLFVWVMAFGLIGVFRHEPPWAEDVPITLGAGIVGGVAFTLWLKRRWRAEENANAGAA